MNSETNFLNVPASPLSINVQPFQASSLIPTQQSANTLSLPSYAIRTDQTITINGGGDLDGNPLILTDDALIYAAKGFTFNNVPILPVNRDSLTGAPILDPLTGKQVLVNNAVTVATGYTTLNANNNPYIGLLPPKVVPTETITIPGYSDTKTQELNLRTPNGTPTFIFHASSNPINNVNDWNTKFPSAGTTTNPKVVKVTGGGLNIPNGVNLSNYIITVESGDINFNGNSNLIDNVVFVANSGNINLGKVQSNNLSVFASGSINMNELARFGGKTLIANNNSNITFNGATKTTTNDDALKVISQGNITFNGTLDIRGDFHSKGTFNANARAAIFGSINAKQNITFNNGAYVTAVSSNTAPTNLTLNTNTTPENVSANSLIGSFSTTDANSGNTFTYSLVTGTESTDNAAFSIINNELRIVNSPNFEAKNSYSINVKTTDQGGLSYEKAFTVNITNVNEAPILATIQNQQIATGTLLSLQAIATDPDIPTTFTYSLEPNAPTGTSINANTGIFTWTPTTAQAGTYSIGIRVTDNGNPSLSDTKIFTTVVTTSNLAPTDLALNPSSVLENIPTNTQVGTFTSIDSNSGNTFTYSLINGLGDTNNSLFTIEGDRLKLNFSPDFENKSSYTIRVKTTDNGGLSFEKALTINITDVNEAPTALVSSNNTTPENVAANSLIGTFTNTDPDTFSQTFTYSLINGTGGDDNSAFTIINNELRINSSPDFEAKNSYSIRVKITDNGNLSFEKTFTIAITNINEAPTFTSTSPTIQNISQPYQYNITTADPENNTLNITATNLPTWLTLTDNQNGTAQLTGNPSLAASGIYNIQLTAKEANTLERLEASQNFSIAVDNTPPAIAIQLQQDTGISTDKITNNPNLTGTVTDAGIVTGTITELKAGFGGTANIDIFDTLSNGTFNLDRNRLNQIAGSTLNDGVKTLTISARDNVGNISTQDFTFTLDTIAPQAPSFTLDSALDTAPIGDAQTSYANVRLVGLTDANATVTLSSTSIKADGIGRFVFGNVALNLGDNIFTVNAQDIAGNTSIFTTNIKRVAQDNSDVVLDWNANMLNAIAVERSAPPIASRNLAIVQTAVFDTINSFTNTYNSYHFVGTAPTGASIEAAAASAAYRTLINLYPNQATFLNSALVTSLAKIPDGAAEDVGVAFGQIVADDILAFRSTDGSSDPTVYTPTNNPGDWQPTAPAFGLALLPKWGEVRPFGLSAGSQFRPGGEPALTSDRYTADFNQIKEIGRIDSTTRTADQTEIAKFWADGAGTYTPPGHWNQIAQNVVAGQGNSLLENARLFALLDIGLADASIAAWDAKYTYASWRPITAIQKADTDGNPNTTADSTWRPLIITPPFPDYISGHSTFSGTADIILTGLLGNNVSFTTNSLGTLGVYRSFNNFASAANEAGISRVYGGIHFGSSNVDGLATGRSVGNYILQNSLTPISTFSLSNTSTPENVPANSLIGSFTSTNPQSSSYTLVSGIGDTDNSAFTIINNELRILNSPDFETKNSYSIRVKTTDLSGISTEKTFAIAILDLNEGTVPAISIQLQQDTGISNSDKITNNPNLTGTIVNVGTITELKAGFNNTPTFDILPSLTNGNFTLDRNLLNQIAESTIIDGQKTLTILAKDSLGNQNTADFTFTFDTTAPQTPTLNLDPAYDTAPIGDSQTTSTNVKLTGQTAANTTVTLLGQSQTSDSTGKYSFSNIPLNLGDNSFTVNAQDLAGNSSTFTSTIKRVAIESDVIQLNLKPGEQIKLESTDIFSSLGLIGAKFSLETLKEMPTGMLEGDGTLIIKPSPLELGTYEFSLIARDGDTVFTKKFVLNVVADPITTTRISGVIKSTDLTPLAGIAVRVGNFVTTTATDGTFTVTLTEPPAEGTAMIIQPDQEAEGIIYPSIAEKLPLVLEHEVYANVNNIIERSIYLPPIDIANATIVDPGIDQIITSAAIPGAAIFIAANSLFDPEGYPYTEEISITTVPRDLTPAALPKNHIPDLVVTIQPGEMQFSTPAPLSLPNLAGYAVGTEMDLWSINPVTGLFDNVGKGHVSADGSVIETISGGIRNSSWHFFSPRPSEPEPGPTPDPSCLRSIAKSLFSSEVELGSGADIETHNLVSYQSLGQTRSLQLVYNSNHVNPRPVVHSVLTSNPRTLFSTSAQVANNLRLVGGLTIKRGNFSLEVSGIPTGQLGLSGGENFWSLDRADTADIALQADLRSNSSGVYQYEMRSGVLQTDSTASSFFGTLASSTGDVLVVNKTKSSFGSGWGLSSLQEIVVNPDRSVLLISGTGSNLIFKASANGGYTAPPEVFSVLGKTPEGTFRLTSKDQTVSQFDTQNRLISVTDRQGNLTRHIYNDQGISKIIDPTGLETNFTYNANGKVSTITDPSGKVTILEYNGAGDLIEVIDPDNTSRSWEYDSNHLIVGEVDQKGRSEQTNYNAFGRATNAVMKDGSVVSLNALETNGLVSPTATLNPLAAPIASTSRNEVVYTDGRGNQSTVVLNRGGQAVNSRDGAGNLNTITRNPASNLVTSVTSGRGIVTSYTYDSKGNVLTTTTPSGTKTYTYDPIFNQVTSATDEIGRKTIFDIDPITGNTRSVNRVVGTVGGNDDLISNYTYTTQGQLDLSIDPLGYITDYDYDAQGRIIKTTFAKDTVDEAIQQFEYDLTGNQTAFIDELGRRTEFRYDLQNQLIETIYADNTPTDILDNPRTRSEYDARGNQITAIDELGRRTTYEYDALDRLVKTTETDPDGVGILSAPKTTYEYDANGNQTAVIDQLGRRTQYQYDARNRLIATKNADNSKETSSYDADNNLVSSSDANENRTKREYDSTSRLIKINEPNGSSTFEYDNASQLTAQTDANGNRTQYFYDELGRRFKTIDALGGISLTSYDKNGNVIAETDELNRTTTFGYDKRDRQITTTTALGFASLITYDSVGNVINATDANNQTTSYFYDPRDRQTEVKDALNQSAKTTYDAVGNVIATTNQLNQTTTYRYDNLNRQTETIDLLNQVTKTEYDAFGNVITAIDPLGKRTSYGYDIRNRRSTVTDSLNGVTTTTYDDFGNILSITDSENNKTAYQFPVQDFISPEISLVSVNSERIQGNSFSYNPSISFDGRFVTYSSNSNNLASGGTNNGQNTFLYDRQTGQTTTVNVNNAVGGDFGFKNPAISPNGKFVAFEAYSSDIDPQNASNFQDIYVQNLETGETIRVSESINGGGGNFNSFRPSISDDGRFVTFDSNATNLVANDTSNVEDVFVRDLQTGETTKISVGNNGSQANSFSFASSISTDGRYVSFVSLASNLVANDTNNTYDTFVHDRQSGLNIRVSVDSNGVQGNQSSGSTSKVVGERFITYSSPASNLVSEDTNNTQDIFVYDLGTGETTRVSVDSNGVQANAESRDPSISEDGRYITFASLSSNLVFNDTNNNFDVFVHDRQSGQTVRVSVDSNQAQGNAESQYPVISGDGRFITFSSTSSNLVPDDTNSTVDVFVVNNPLFAFGNSSVNSTDINRLAKEINANGNERSYTYDNVGNITSVTDRDNTVQRYTYDKLNRRTKEEWINNNADVTRTITNTYNAASELTNISDLDSTYRYTYDLDGRVLAISNQGTPNVPTTIMTYSYDNVGNTQFITETINGTLVLTTSQQYDPLNRLTQTIQGTKRVDYAYNAISQVANKKRYSDIQGTLLVAETNHTYDSVNRLTNIVHSKDGNIISSYTQTYDADSKITGITSSDGTSTYAYDDTDQLIISDYNFQTDENYTYDANGNRTNTGYVTGVNNRLLEDNKYRYEYDEVGNRTSRIDKITNEYTLYIWDIRDRLTGITVINELGEVIKTASYIYDVYDQRIAKIVDLDGDGSGAATTERFVYGTNQNIALVFDESGNLTNRYMFANGIDQIEADEKVSTGTTLWALTDHLGSVRDVVDNSGTVQNHIVYDAFGNVISQSNSSVIFKFGFTAREFDKESGLQFNRGRYVDTFTGQFISQDKSGFNGGDTNLYRYVFNSPLNSIDPSGYEEINWGSLFNGGLSLALQLDAIKTTAIVGTAGYLFDKAQQGLNRLVNETGIVQDTGRLIDRAGNFINQGVSAILNPFISRPTKPPSPFVHPPNGGIIFIPTTETYPLPQLPDPRPLISRADSYIQSILDNITRPGPNCNDNLKIPPFLSIDTDKADITSSQQSNIGRFIKKAPANSKDNIEIFQLPNGGLAVQANSPGKVSGSSAVYEKQIDSNGKTTQYTKTVYDPQGKIISVKDKITGKQLFP